MHLVLLYGLDDGPCPSDCELVLWVIGCSQLIGKWEVDDNSNITLASFPVNGRLPKRSATRTRSVSGSSPLLKRATRDCSAIRASDEPGDLGGDRTESVRSDVR